MKFLKVWKIFSKSFQEIKRIEKGAERHLFFKKGFAKSPAYKKQAFGKMPKAYLHTFRPERISYYEVIFHPRSGFHRAYGSISLKKRARRLFFSM